MNDVFRLRQHHGQQSQQRGAPRALRQQSHTLRTERACANEAVFKIHETEVTHYYFPVFDIEVRVIPVTVKRPWRDACWESFFTQLFSHGIHLYAR